MRERKSECIFFCSDNGNEINHIHENIIPRSGMKLAWAYLEGIGRVGGELLKAHMLGLCICFHNESIFI